jgi:hypothetical protein
MNLYFVRYLEKFYGINPISGPITFTGPNSYWNLVYSTWSKYNSHLINSWADIINRADLGMEVMHERNAHNFPLDLA